ncbi:MAG: ATP-binding cassette domain-containing protein [Canidatus Methanoxibalbensis ujae]|nr:ATP-binding cassette domain-containing protein [Candidatus Methanoxibalbensis ujae]MCW7077631.1 ATP-binding cassette domain-containing protein [Candidatus Methanoxibalbensis ujae]
MTAIDVRNLTKCFSPQSPFRRLIRRNRDIVAVDNISFSVDDGEIFALLGPNGAGKTTTLKILTTLLKPTSGHARVAGFDVVSERDAVRKKIGIVFQESSLDLRLTGRENLDFHARMYGLSSVERKRRTEEVLKLVDMEEYADVLVSKYSGGMRRRLEIARGFIHHPEVLFLDEPTLGLDVHTRRRIWTFIKKLNEEENITILLTTHYIEEADFLCSRVAIMQNGKIIAIDEPEKLKNNVKEDIVMIIFGNSEDYIVENTLKMFSELNYVHDIIRENNTIMLKVEHADMHIAEIIEIARISGLEINSVNFRKPSLEDVFIELTGKPILDTQLSCIRHQ